METRTAQPRLETVLDWERAKDIGPHPSRTDLHRFFTASELPPRYGTTIEEFFRRDAASPEARDGEGNALALLRQYYEHVRNHPDIYDKREVMNLLARTPEHARELQDIFVVYPELMRAYARIAPQPPSDPNRDTPVGSSRISATLNPEIIRHHLEENATFAKEIVTTHGIPHPNEPGHSANNFEKNIQACYGDQVNIWGGIIEKRTGDSWLRFRISPPSPFQEGRDSWFEPYEFSIKLQNGIVDSPPLSHHQFENLGFLFYDASFRGVDEHQLLDLLTHPEDASPDDWDTWAEPYLEAQGLFGPKRD